MFRCFVCLKHFFKLWNLFCGWGLKAKKKMDWIKISATMFGRRGSIFKSYWLNNRKNFLSSTISPKLVTLLDYHWNLQSLSPYWTGWFFSHYIRIIKQMFNRFLVSQIAFNAFHRRKQSLACSNCCRHNKKKLLNWEVLVSTVSGHYFFPSHFSISFPIETSFQSIIVRKGPVVL